MGVPEPSAAAERARFLAAWAGWDGDVPPKRLTRAASDYAEALRLAGRKPAQRDFMADLAVAIERKYCSLSAGKLTKVGGI